ICGGFQMLGSSIADPHHLESLADRADGLGLLPLTTVLASEKTLVRVEATHLPSSLPVCGYEIHHGQTDGGDLAPLFRRADGQTCGVATLDDRVWGAYLHGVFDADPFRRWFIDRLRVRRGLEPLGSVQATYDLEPAFERLADVVRASLDMGEVYRLMGL
ncbi:threonine-phosphate decarboxylase, partial [bacterium]|nr:threonine-phosphate decarboxylase [bacterium]